MTTELSIAGFNVQPGQRLRGSLDFVHLADGSDAKIPLLLINGTRPGPRIYLGAAIHGDEVTGTAILSEALAAVDPQRLAGQIVCVPVQHPLAFHADHRLPLAQFMKSPLDQAPADAWTCFPGSQNGNLAQFLAHTLFQLIRQCQFAIDIHTPTRGGRYVPIAILPDPGLDQDGRIEKLARGLGTGWIMRTDEGFYIAPGILCVEAARAGVPSLTFEIGEGGRLEPQVIQEGAACILNAMQSLNMIEFERKDPREVHIMRYFLGLRATRGGLLYNEVELGQSVKQGDLLCRVVGIFGDELERFTAPREGYVVRLTTLSTVTTGERVATLGIT